MPHREYSCLSRHLANRWRRPSIDHKAEKIADPHTRHTHEARITPKIFSECYTASICEFRLSKLLVIREGKRQTLLRASRFVLGSYHS